MVEESKPSDKFTLISELAKRRGFYWQSYEIYGGVGGFFTYGPMGTRLKHNIEDKLRQLFVGRLGILELESPIIAPEKVFEASGHIEHFKEPMVECLKCRKKFRADHLLREFSKLTEAEAEKLSLDELRSVIDREELACPDCEGSLGEPRYFLTMFKTTIGPYSEAIGYGRPEVAQGIFVEFGRLREMAREKLPFGVIQIGRALRNEISPRQGLLRLRELTIADLEFFFDPEEPNCYLLTQVEDEPLQILLAEDKLKKKEDLTEVTVKEALKKGYIKSEWQASFMAFAKRLLIDLGVPAEKQRFVEKLPWEKAHYSLQTFDQEVLVERWGWVEVSGHAYRTDYDLKGHIESSGQDMYVFKEYQKPIEVEELTVKPIMAKLGPAFKKEAAKVAELLSKTDPKELDRVLKSDGHYMLDHYKILTEHVDIKRVKTVERGRRFIPHVVEPSFGSDRLFYVALEYAYRSKDGRTLLSFPRDLAPIQIGVYPLVSKDGISEKASGVHKILVNEGFFAEFDEAGSIGRRYARADEIGIPLGVTVDYDSLKEDTVTIRDRDSWKQVRTKIADLPGLLHDYFGGKRGFEGLGELIKG